jgi:hypothetical protein
MTTPTLGHFLHLQYTLAVLICYSLGIEGIESQSIAKGYLQTKRLRT